MRLKMKKLKTVAHSQNYDQNKMFIIITTILFQEDNIFGMYASLTYGPQLQR